LRPFICGQFIRAYLAGEGPYVSAIIDPSRGAPTEEAGYSQPVKYSPGLPSNSLCNRRDLLSFDVCVAH